MGTFFNIQKLYGFGKSLVTSRSKGYFHIKRSGGVDLTSSLEAKFGAGSNQVHQIRGKTWEVLSLQDAEVGGKYRNFWVKSEIQREKFLVFVTYILEAKFRALPRISEANFCAKRLQLPDMEVTPLGITAT